MEKDNRTLASAAMLGPDAYKTDTEDIAGMIISAAGKAERIPPYAGPVNLSPVRAEELREDVPSGKKNEDIGRISERWEEPFYSVPRVL